MRKYTLTFDGGSRGNPGPAYGSYQIESRGGKPQAPVRINLGQGTNNQAEYWTLITGLKAFLSQLSEKSIDPKSVSLEIQGDSRLVINQLGGNWKAKNPRMHILRDEALSLLNQFGEVHLLRLSRWLIVETLGH